MQLKAQISVEHIVILMLVLALIIPLTAKFSSNSANLVGGAYETIIDNQAKKILDAIAIAPMLGESSRNAITVNMPNNFLNASIEENKTLIFNLENGGSVEQFVYLTKFPVVYDGVMPTLGPGRQKFFVKSYEGGVCITYDGTCGSYCGNNRIDPGEYCDGQEKNSSCIMEGYLGGELVCNSSCNGYITDYCI